LRYHYQQKKFHKIAYIFKNIGAIDTKINRPGIPPETKILNKKISNKFIFAEVIVNARKFHTQRDRQTNRHTYIKYQYINAQPCQAKNNFSLRFEYRTTGV
jgi:hypothetical protein